MARVITASAHLFDPSANYCLHVAPSAANASCEQLVKSPPADWVPLLSSVACTPSAWSGDHHHQTQGADGVPHKTAKLSYC